MSAKIITVHNVNHALLEGLWWLKVAGAVEDSRNGRVLVAPGPVITETQKPKQRVLFSARRDCNPFFHLLESMWMLAGRNDTASLTKFVARMQEFSDDGVTLNGAYGYRWREHFGYDQLAEIIHELTKNPTTRRCVLTMWDGGSYVADGDLIKATVGSKDVPCNTHIYFRRRDKLLDMTVLCRSNDAVWGAHGANAVHFSVLHEYVALRVGCEVGTMYQVSNNYHMYADRPDTKNLYYMAPGDDRANDHVLYAVDDRYGSGTQTVPLLQYKEDHVGLDDDIGLWFDVWQHCGAEQLGILQHEANSLYFRNVFMPLMVLHARYKEGLFANAFEANDWMANHLSGAIDWHQAGAEWVHRRLAKKASTA